MECTLCPVSSVYSHPHVADSMSASNLSAWVSKGQPSPALSFPLIYITKQAESQWQTVIGDVRGQEFDCQAEWDWRMDGKRGSKRRADGGKEDGVCDKHDLMGLRRNKGGRLGLHTDMRRTRKYMNVGRRLRSLVVVSSFLGKRRKKTGASKCTLARMPRPRFHASSDGVMRRGAWRIQYPMY